MQTKLPKRKTPYFVFHWTDLNGYKPFKLSMQTVKHRVFKNKKESKNKKCFRNMYAPLGAKFKITTYMYKAL